MTLGEDNHRLASFWLHQPEYLLTTMFSGQ